MNILMWDSEGEYLADAKEPARHAVSGMPTLRARTEATLDKVLIGDPSVLNGATEVLNTVEAQVATGQRMTWGYHVAGGSINVARFAMGMPQMCNRRVLAETAFRQVKVIVNTTCSAGIDGNAAMRRAACIIGLLQRLTAEGIDLDLYLLEEGEAPYEGLASRATGKPWANAVKKSDNSCDYVQLVKISTRPINMAQAAYLLTSLEPFRDVVLPAAMGEFVGTSAGRWPTTRNVRGVDFWTALTRSQLDLSPHDVLIGAFHYDEIHMDPQKWIAKYAAQALGTSAVAA